MFGRLLNGNMDIKEGFVLFIRLVFGFCKILDMTCTNFRIIILSGASCHY